jgi:hypothetical protein
MTVTETPDLAALLAADPTFLDQLADRLKARPDRYFNMQGEAIAALAVIGRVQVSPGQTISSASWGNPVWDQSINCFNSTADRDTQWLTPHEGAECFTVDTGSPWVYRAGAWHGRPKGYVASVIGPAANTDCTPEITVMSVAFPVVIGRRYRITGFINGGQVTAAGSPRARLTAPTGGPLTFDLTSGNGTWVSFAATSVAAGVSVVESAAHTATATATGTATVNLTGSAGTGALRVNANACQILIEDIGS